jgi:hypothetical protein
MFNLVKTRYESLLLPNGDAVAESVMILWVICLCAQLQPIELALQAQNGGEFSLRVDSSCDVSSLGLLLHSDNGSGSVLSIHLIVGDESCSLANGNDVSEVVLHAALDG